MTQEDKHIKQKIDNLDTLSGGIVFGKEEAWDKLQARMDSKPARKMPVIYWLAAAAVLLLMCGIVALYTQPAKQIAKTLPANTKEEIPAAATRETSPAQIENITTQNAQLPAKQKYRTAHDNKLPAITLIQPPPPIQPVTEQRPKDTTAIAKTYMSHTPAKQPMKVVQVNELYDDNQQTTQTIAANTSFAKFKSLPVVHVNDLNDYEQRRRIDRYPSRIWDNFAVNVPFLNPNERRASTDYSDQNYTTLHSLKLKIN